MSPFMVPHLSVCDFLLPNTMRSHSFNFDSETPKAKKMCTQTKCGVRCWTLMHFSLVDCDNKPAKWVPPESYNRWLRFHLSCFLIERKWINIWSSQGSGSFISIRELAITFTVIQFSVLLSISSCTTSVSRWNCAIFRKKNLWMRSESSRKKVCFESPTFLWRNRTTLIISITPTLGTTKPEAADKWNKLNPIHCQFPFNSILSRKFKSIEAN